MKPSARRRIEREIQKIMQTDGEHCSICRKKFGANSRTFGGVNKIGTAMLTGECCRNKLGTIILEGLYVSSQDFPGLNDQVTSRSTPLSRDEIDKAITSFQELATEREKTRRRVAKRAGLDPDITKVFHEPSDWKADDAAWFEEHPDRSHRLRSAFPGEFTGADLGDLPGGHILASIVRQIEPGVRLREPFGRNILRHIPDDEDTLHALFDVVSDRGSAGTQLRSDEIERRAARLRDRNSSGSN